MKTHLTLLQGAALLGLAAACASDPVVDDDGAGGQGGGGSGGTGAGGTIVTGPDAVIVTQGDPSIILLQGVVVTPDQAFEGHVLVTGSVIGCVDVDCSAHPSAASATVVHTGGIIMPGMIDTHNHILFAPFDEDDWTAPKAYDNHNQWPNDERYGHVVDGKQFLNGEGDSTVDLNCELLKFGELRAMMNGTTSVLGASNPQNKICYRTLARTIDQSANRLCAEPPEQSACPDTVQAHTLFPSKDSADGVCANFADGDTTSYFVHAGEGVDASSLNEFYRLRDASTQPGCLFDARTTIVHGTAFTEVEFAEMAKWQMGLSWSPRSNVFLYGLGTDLSKTTNIPLVLSYGITVALSPDWSLGGGPTLLQELPFADLVDNTVWGNVITPQQLTQMVTVNAAFLLAMSNQIGFLAPGMKADILVLGGDAALPFESILAAGPAEVRLVMVDGEVLYGDDQLAPLGPTTPGCEPITACGRNKFVCVAAPAATADNKFGQTLVDIESALAAALGQFDAANPQEAPLSPLSPWFRCE